MTLTGWGVHQKYIPPGILHILFPAGTFGVHDFFWLLLGGYRETRLPKKECGPKNSEVSEDLKTKTNSIQIWDLHSLPGLELGDGLGRRFEPPR